jgi:hypothetical protein
MATSPIITRLIARHGQAATLQMAGAGQAGAWLDVPMVAHFMRADLAELVDGATVQQLDTLVRVPLATLEANGAPRLPRQGDRVVLDGKAMAVESVESRAVLKQRALIMMRVRG